MGPHHRGEAWQLEDKRRKRRKPHGAVHALVYEESNEGDSSFESNTPGRLLVIKHIKNRPVVERKVEETEDLERKEEALVAPCSAAVGEQRESKLQGDDRPVPKAIFKAGAKGKNSDKNSKNYLIRTDSFVVFEEDEAELFQRRGSFLIPQGAPVQGQELIVPENPAIPFVATPHARSHQKMADSSKVKSVTGHMQLQPETMYISKDDSPSDNFFMRRGSFLVHPEDAVGLMGTTSKAEGVGNDPAVQVLVEHDDFRRGIDAATPQARSQQSAGGSSTIRIATRHEKVQPGSIYISTEDSSSHQFFMRRGSFLVHPEDAVNLMGASSSTEAGNEPSVQYSVEHDTDSKRGVDMKRGTFMMSRVEQDVATAARQRDARRRSFILVEDASLSEASDQANGSALQRGSFMTSGAERKGESSSTRGMDVRRGSFIVVEDAGISSKPEARYQTKGSAGNLKHSALQSESTSGESSKHPVHHADEDNKSHVAHKWLFD